MAIDQELDPVLQNSQNIKLTDLNLKVNGAPKEAGKRVYPPA
ncbi:hypothetical protein MY4038_007288 [Beauveria bassiana]